MVANFQFALENQESYSVLQQSKILSLLILLLKHQLTQWFQLDMFETNFPWAKFTIFIQKFLKIMMNISTLFWYFT